VQPPPADSTAYLTFSRWACVALHVSAALPAGAQTADAAMTRIKAHGEIVIGYRQGEYSPFSYLDASQKPVGYTIDLCLAVVGAIKQRDFPGRT